VVTLPITQVATAPAMAPLITSFRTLDSLNRAIEDLPGWMATLERYT
jgi:hypothetical protein